MGSSGREDARIRGHIRNERVDVTIKRIAADAGIVYDERMTLAEFALAVESRRRS
jgi:limonene-1,2-epoxide hydrolase